MIRKLLLLSLITLTQTSYANVPVCPSLKAIHAVGIEHVSSVAGWTGYIFRNNFDTDVDWSFTISGFSAKDDADALKQANASIIQLTLNDDLSKPGDTCIYMGYDPSLVGIAISPSPVQHN